MSHLWHTGGVTEKQHGNAKYCKPAATGRKNQRQLCFKHDKTIVLEWGEHPNCSCFVTHASSSGWLLSNETSRLATSSSMQVQFARFNVSCLFCNPSLIHGCARFPPKPERGILHIKPCIIRQIREWVMVIQLNVLLLYGTGLDHHPFGSCLFLAPFSSFFNSFLLCQMCF